MVMDNNTVRKHKAALTRAKKIGPEKVFEVSMAALADFEENGYPDCWHIWKMAAYDADLEIQRKNWRNSWSLKSL